MLEDGIYKVVGSIVIAVFTFIMVCRLLGFQSKIVEGLASKKTEGYTNSLMGDNSLNSEDLAKKNDQHTNNVRHITNQGNSDDRQGQEQLIMSIDDRLRAELLGHTINSKTDSNGTVKNQLLTAGKTMIDNPHCMELIRNMNELWKFRETLEGVMHTLDNTHIATSSFSGDKIG